jgi:hypothetical protein
VEQSSALKVRHDTEARIGEPSSERSDPERPGLGARFQRAFGEDDLPAELADAKEISRAEVSRSEQGLVSGEYDDTISFGNSLRNRPEEEKKQLGRAQRIVGIGNDRCGGMSDRAPMVHLERDNEEQIDRNDPEKTGRRLTDHLGTPDALR